MHEAVDELGDRETFKGYGPEQGYEFLREAIVENEFAGLDIAADEIFISDGSKCDTGNILDIFGQGNVIAITDPVYPVYVDTNVMAGNTGDADDSGAYARPALSALHRGQRFRRRRSRRRRSTSSTSASRTTRPAPWPPASSSKRGWTTPKANDAIILFDAAYEAFIQRPGHPAFHLRNRRRARVRHRVPQLLEERRLHRRALRLHRDAEDRHRQRRRRQPNAAAPALDPPPHHQVQRRQLSRAARRRRGLLGGRQGDRSARSSSTTWAMPRSSARPPQPPASRFSAA